MKAKALLLTLLLTFCAGMLVIGCSREEIISPDAPLPPSGSQIVAANDTSLTLSWKASADSAQVTGYRVIRVGAGDSVVTDLPATARSIQFTGLIRGLGYLISIYAMRNEALSDPLIVQWNSRKLPKTPSGLNAVADGATNAIVTWMANDTGITSYRLAWDGVTYKDSGAMELPATITTARITNLRFGQLYNIWISASRGGMISTTNLFCLAFNDDTPPPFSPLNLMATPLSQSTVGLRWMAPNDTGTIAYRIRYSVKGESMYDSIETATTSATITGLTPGALYSFSVITMRMGKSSTAITTESAPSARYASEPGSSTPLRIYEKASVNGAGFTIDPAKGGPKNVKITATNPPVVQMVMLVRDQEASFQIGPPYAFDEYQAYSNFANDLYISDSTYQAGSVDDWYYSGTIIEKITDPEANRKAYQLPQSTGSATYGQGFFVRTGTAGNYHYARVFIKNNGGKLLQGTAPNRYVELEISYQMTPNLPFAKTSGNRNAPAGVVAQRLR